MCHIHYPSAPFSVSLHTPTRQAKRSPLDAASIASSIALLKGGIDAIRSAIGLTKDAQGLLPGNANADTVSRALDQAEQQVKIAEAQIAQALGYKLCRCEFPPHPMLLVGYQQGINEHGIPTRHRDVFKCPCCKRTTPPGAYLTSPMTVVFTN